MLCQLERCQQWFLKNVFYVPKFAPGDLLLKISNLNSIESEIDLKKTLVFGSFLRLTLPLLGSYQAFVKPLINMIYSTIFSRGS